jgi:drug/metabolite transporter (DMT)-like permease
MTGLIGGLLAALCWGTATTFASRGSRIAGAAPALAWQVVIGSLLITPFLIANPNPAPHGGQWWFLLIAGVGNVVGLLLEFQGFRTGPVAVVATLASLEGAVAAIVAMISGERPPAVFLAILPILVIGLVMVTLQPADVTYTRKQWLQAVAFGAASGLSFGLSLFATGNVSQNVSTVWAVMPSRIIGLIGLTLPLLFAGKLRIPRAAVPWVVVSGVGDTLGFVAFAIGSSHGIAIAAVLGSQFAVVTTILAAVILKEKLHARQYIGVVVVALGVAALAAIRAGAS